MFRSLKLVESILPVKIEEVGDGIVMRLGKKSCTCPIASTINESKEMLCHCTCGHEKAVDIEIVESFLRGGTDCVIKIKI